MQEAESKRQLKQQISWDIAANKSFAKKRTEECQRAMLQMERVLRDGIEADHCLDWDALKDRSAFSVPKPAPPVMGQVPVPPDINKFDPHFNWFEYLLPPLKRRRREQADHRFREAESDWVAFKQNIEQQNARSLAEHEEALRVWEVKLLGFRAAQTAQHREIELRRARYLEKDHVALHEYWETVLSNSEYPDTFPRSFLIEYLSESRTLIVEYALPSIACLPSVKEVKYIQARSSFQETAVSQAWLNKTYDELLYQIALRTLHELFQSDEAGALDGVVFNGWVNSVDKATGQDVNACILSIQVNKAEFMAVNLAQVEPKACFKKFKGVSAAKLTELTPVRPVLQLNKEDRRFISPYEVAGSLDSSSNIAAMDWQDFENLIREIFEKEFSQNGGEVKITQASRDGGVDAVAFDPDPIRGGKIVIQAKRYTNTVSVSSVRDLYGTVLNEGAMKGILVTTADYGRDAFEFAKDKPLTLISGNELLYLLQKHGHRVRIDLQEARRLAAAQ
ncbi:MAG: restriction endonuclease [Candidatus Korobacteraceae bacterium]